MLLECATYSARFVISANSTMLVKKILSFIQNCSILISMRYRVCLSAFVTVEHITGEPKCVYTQGCCANTQQSQVQCFVSPCFNQEKLCPNATNCVADYCTGCNAHWYDKDWNEICTETTTVGPIGQPMRTKRHNPPVCRGVTCPSGQKCIPSPKQCFTTPCPQYDCVWLLYCWHFCSIVIHIQYLLNVIDLICTYRILRNSDPRLLFLRGSFFQRGLLLFQPHRDQISLSQIRVNKYFWINSRKLCTSFGCMSLVKWKNDVIEPLKRILCMYWMHFVPDVRSISSLSVHKFVTHRLPFLRGSLFLKIPYMHAQC